MKKIITIIQVVLSLNVWAQSDVKQLVKQLNSVFQQKNINAIKENLAANFSVAAFTNQSALAIFQSLSEKYACDSVVFIKETSTTTDKKIELRFYPSLKPSIVSAITTTLDNKICYIDLLDQLQGMNRYIPAKLQAKIPFEIIDNTIVITLKLNNSTRPLKFLFDTGADGMAISEALADILGLKVTRKQNASIVGGAMQISISEKNDVYLDSFLLKNQNIALFKKLRKGIDGLIGNTLAKKYITRVDFDKKELSLFNFGIYEYEPTGKSIPVTITDGLFIISGIVETADKQSNTGNFVFDTGASSYSLICFRPFVKQNKLLVNGFKSEYSGTTSSMGISTPTYSGKASSFTFSNMPKINNMPITLMAGAGQSENWNPGFDGSIGLKLISRYNFTINLLNKEIHLTPNQNFQKPFDFVLGAYLFTVNTKNELVVDHIINPDETEPLNTGTIINSINNIPVSKLLKDQQKLLQLQNSPAGTIFKIEYIKKGEKTNKTISKT